ncbi:MAG: MMPL family transporter [Methanomassiliicoccaceae archaeon]|nr:MMPL family transporter [Methanomassiliicoccaceae archaeon]
MIFERLADVILKRSKLIVVIWIIVLICAVPFILKAGSVLQYDTTDMAGPDAESIRGAEVIDEYFYKPDTAMESAVILVASFDTLQGKLNALGLQGAMVAGASGYTFVDKDGNTKTKIPLIRINGLFTSQDDENKGVVFISVGYDAEFDSSMISDDTPELRDFIKGLLPDGSGVTTYVSGSPAIMYDTQVAASGDLSKIDVFSILMILLLVGLFFRSFVTSAMPPMTIGVAFGTTLCLMFFIGSVINIMYMTEMLLIVSMLGAGSDYCIFILARYREERVHGAEHEVAVKRAVTWAGESITTSGLAVMIGFGAMSICSFSMISSMGIMLAVGIVVALVAALTLITSILTIFGEKLFWPTKMGSLMPGGKAEKGWHGKVSRLGHKYFTSSVNASIKYAKLIIAVAVLVTMPAAYIMATSDSSYDMVGAMSTGESTDGMSEIVKFSNGGMLMPNYGIYELQDPIGTVTEYNLGDATIGMLYWANPSYITKLSALSSALGEDDNAGEIWGVYSWSELAEKAASEIPKGSMSDHDYVMAVYSKATEDLPDTIGKGILSQLEAIVAGYEAFPFTPPVAVYNDPTLIALMDYILNYSLVTSVGGERGTSTSFDLTYVKITLITKAEAMSDRSMDTIGFMDRTMKEFADNNPDMVAATWLTGSAIVMYEISELVSDEFLKVEILAVILIFILLFFVMKSYVTPIRSILTILMSVTWTVAMTHLIFGSLLGVGVIWMIPIILIVVCLGLGMDYDILLTTRIKENRMHKGLSNDEAIRFSVTHSGSVITICGLIMGGAFGTLMLSSTIMLQQFGFALCFAILVDALLVRTYIVPAVMHLLGDLNWKGPKFLHKGRTEPLE